MLKKRKIIIVDGYNVLRNNSKYVDVVGAAPNFKDWTSDVLNAAREALLNDVAQLLDKNCSGIIVYDAANRKGPTEVELPSQKIKNLQVIFTHASESADTRIQKLAYNFRQKGMEVQIITSDLGIQDATMNNGVVRTSAHEFEMTINENKMHTISSISKTDAHLKSKIEDIVDNDMAEKLRKLRDSI